MKLNQYQERAVESLRWYPSWIDATTGLVMGLASRAIKLMDHFRSVRDHNHDFRKEATKEVLGDILWYTAAVAEMCHLNLEDCAQTNLDKIKRTYPSGFSMEQYMRHNKQRRASRCR